MVWLSLGQQRELVTFHNCIKVEFVLFNVVDNPFVELEELYPFRLGSLVHLVGILILDDIVHHEERNICLGRNNVESEVLLLSKCLVC